MSLTIRGGLIQNWFHTHTPRRYQNQWMLKLGGCHGNSRQGAGPYSAPLPPASERVGLARLEAHLGVAVMDGHFPHLLSAVATVSPDLWHCKPLWLSLVTDSATGYTKIHPGQSKEWLSLSAHPATYRIFLIYGWLNLRLWNPWIQKVNCKCSEPNSEVEV